MTGGHRENLLQDKMVAEKLWSSQSDRSHLISPGPFTLDEITSEKIRKLGDALSAFYRAVNVLYMSRYTDWACDYLDKGKPEHITNLAREKYQRNTLPAVIRPDILLTKDGMKITELDSVPGGIGHTELMSRHYIEHGHSLMVGGVARGFCEMIKSNAKNEACTLAIVVSDESGDYRQEMDYLARCGPEYGIKSVCVHPEELDFDSDGVYVNIAGKTELVDVIYRFYELFDLENVQNNKEIEYLAKGKRVVVTPPYRHHFEEKMLIALFFHEGLADFWKSNMSCGHIELLKEVFVPTYILDPRPVPPHAHIAGFRFASKKIRDWMETAEGSQKDRRLVIKPSGFSPLAWGSRGVSVGHDMNAEDWKKAIEHALLQFESGPYVLQPFCETSLFGVKYYEGDGQAEAQMDARIRLCPYYFAAGEDVILGGVLLTACRKNKKIIHGMKDAVMCPCALSEKSNVSEDK